MPLPNQLVRRTERGMIRQVRCVDTQVGGYVLPDRKGLAEGGIELRQTWAVHAVAVHIAERPRSRCGKGVDIEPLDNSLRVSFRIADHVGELITIQRQAIN